MLILRFDFRLGEDAPTTRSDLFSAALDMTEWAEQHDAYTVIFNEHHGSPDGYLPSPLIMATAAATRTSKIPISVAALLLLMYDPVKLAEDMITLDHLSNGRVSYTIGPLDRWSRVIMSSASFTGSYINNSSAATEMGTFWVRVAAAVAMISGDGR